MSGFCGVTGMSQDTAQSVINAMLEAVKHRITGDTDTYVGEHITIAGNHANSTNSEGIPENVYIFFDGKNYNTNSVGANLAPTESDIDMLGLYEKYGTDIVHHIHEPFALAIYDSTTNRLFCARDPFGTKPLYYTQTETGLIFGSEIKAFLHHPEFTPKVNNEALAQYLSFQYSVLNETFFEGVYKLSPGHCLTWENGELKMESYHNGHAFNPLETTFDETIEKIDKTVCKSIEMHMEPYTEVGSFLSGGVDSGYISSVASTLGAKKTFTVGFDHQKYNEIEYAKSLSDRLGVEHVSKIITTEKFWEHLPKVQYHMDEPLADPAAVAFYFACREASQHVKIAFSGEGADEFFGGYNIYKEPLSLRCYTWLPLWFRKLIAKLAIRLPKRIKGRNFLIRGAKTVEERFIGNANIFTKEERDKLLKFPSKQSPQDITRPYYKQAKHHDDVTKMQHLDIHLWLTDDILLQGDKLSAAHGLEVRMPLMHNSVFQVASSLPTRYRVTKKDTKVAFRKAAARHLPQETATRYKLGFPVPIRIWLREEKYYTIVKECFSSTAAKEYFHQDELLLLLEEHFEGKQDNSRKLWAVYMFLLWHKEFFNEGDIS